VIDDTFAADAFATAGIGAVASLQIPLFIWAVYHDDSSYLAGFRHVLCQKKLVNLHTKVNKG
jgi:hypothetical protein